MFFSWQIFYFQFKKKCINNEKRLKDDIRTNKGQLQCAQQVENFMTTIRMCFLLLYFIMKKKLINHEKITSDKTINNNNTIILNIKYHYKIQYFEQVMFRHNKSLDRIVNFQLMRNCIFLCTFNVLKKLISKIFFHINVISHQITFLEI